LGSPTSGAASGRAPSIGSQQAACPNVAPPHLRSDDGKHSETQCDPNRKADQFAPRRQLGDLPHDEFEAGLGREARFIAALTERRNVAWHACGMPEDGCPTVSGEQGPSRVRFGWEAVIRSPELMVRSARCGSLRSRCAREVYARRARLEGCANAEINLVYLLILA